MQGIVMHVWEFRYSYFGGPQP